VANPGGASLPPLERIHPDALYQSGSPKLALEYWRRQSTPSILQSLLPGTTEALRVLPDGRVLNGNTRIKVLEERGIDVNRLPREVVS